MSAIALYIVTILYAAQGIYCAFNSQVPQAVILAGYSLANVGLIWSMR